MTVSAALALAVATATRVAGRAAAPEALAEVWAAAGNEGDGVDRSVFGVSAKATPFLSSLPGLTPPENSKRCPGGLPYPWPRVLVCLPLLLGRSRKASTEITKATSTFLNITAASGAAE